MSSLQIGHVLDHDLALWCQRRLVLLELMQRSHGLCQRLHMQRDRGLAGGVPDLLGFRCERRSVGACTTYLPVMLLLGSLACQLNAPVQNCVQQAGHGHTQHAHANEHCHHQQIAATCKSSHKSACDFAPAVSGDAERRRAGSVSSVHSCGEHGCSALVLRRAPTPCTPPTALP
jgi:hypothetical protein